MAGPLGAFPVFGMNQDVSVALLQLTTVDGADPTINLSNPQIASATRTGEGVIKVTLKDKYNHILPVVSVVESTLTSEVKVSAMVQGQSATNYVEVTTDIQDGTPAADDLPGAVINLVLFLSNMVGP